MTKLFLRNSLGFLLIDAARLFRKTFENAAVEMGLDLTPGEIRALTYVLQFEGTRQAVLADRMGVEPMTLSAYLDRLEIRGLISRTVDPSDRRAKVVRLTEAAERVFAEVELVASGLYERTVSGFTEDERAMVEALLQRMRANLSSDPPILGQAISGPRHHLHAQVKPPKS